MYVLSIRLLKILSGTVRVTDTNVDLVRSAIAHAFLDRSCSSDVVVLDCPCEYKQTVLRSC